MRLKERKCDKAYSSCVLLAQFFEPAKSRTYRSDFQEFSTRYLARSDGALAYIGRGTLALDPCEAESADGCCGYDARRSEPASLPVTERVLARHVIASGCSARGCVCGTVVFCFSATFARCSHTIHAPNDNAVSETSTPATWNVRRHSL